MQNLKIFKNDKFIPFNLRLKIDLNNIIKFIGIYEKYERELFLYVKKVSEFDLSSEDRINLNKKIYNLYIKEELKKENIYLDNFKENQIELLYKCFRDNSFDNFEMQFIKNNIFFINADKRFHSFDFKTGVVISQTNYEDLSIKTSKLLDDTKIFKYYTKYNSDDFFIEQENYKKDFIKKFEKNDYITYEYALEINIKNYGDINIEPYLEIILKKMDILELHGDGYKEDIIYSLCISIDDLVFYTLRPNINYYKIRKSIFHKIYGKIINYKIDSFKKNMKENFIELGEDFSIDFLTLNKAQNEILITHKFFDIFTSLM